MTLDARACINQHRQPADLSRQIMNGGRRGVRQVNKVLIRLTKLAEHAEGGMAS